MEEKFIKKVFGITLLVYFASICLVYLVSSKQFHYQETQSDTVSQSQVVGEFDVIAEIPIAQHSLKKLNITIPLSRYTG